MFSGRPDGEISHTGQPSIIWHRIELRNSTKFKTRPATHQSFATPKTPNAMEIKMRTTPDTDNGETPLHKALAGQLAERIRAYGQNEAEAVHKFHDGLAMLSRMACRRVQLTGGTHLFFFNDIEGAAEPVEFDPQERRYTLLSPEQVASQLVWACGSAGDKCDLRATYRELSACFDAVTAIVTRNPEGCGVRHLYRCIGPLEDILSVFNQ